MVLACGKRDVNKGNLTQLENASESTAGTERDRQSNRAALCPSIRMRGKACGVGGIVRIERRNARTGRTLQPSKSKGSQAYQAMIDWQVRSDLQGMLLSVAWIEPVVRFLRSRGRLSRIEPDGPHNSAGWLYGATVHRKARSVQNQPSSSSHCKSLAEPLWSRSRVCECRACRHRPSRVS